METQTSCLPFITQCDCNLNNAQLLLLYKFFFSCRIWQAETIWFSDTWSHWWFQQKSLVVGSHQVKQLTSKCCSILFTMCEGKWGGCPLQTRTDCGTENGIIAGAQCYFRTDDDAPFSGEQAHVFGSSPHNQRIENWWSRLKTSCTKLVDSVF